MVKGALAFSVLRIWPIFGVLHGLRVFSNFVFGFRFSSKIVAVFRIVFSSAFYGFTGFAKEVTPRSLAKSGAILVHGTTYMAFYPFFRGMDDKSSLFSSYYLGRNGKAQDYIKARLFLKYLAAGIISCGL